MARIGFRKAKYNTIDSTTGKYTALVGDVVPMFEKVVDEKFSPEFNTAELYANDSLAESDYTFKSGTLSLTVADDKDEFCAKLLGNTITTAVVKQNINDVAPECGYGHIIPKVVGGVKKYKVEFFPRVKFTSISSEAKTRADSVEFQTTAIEAKVYACENAIGSAVYGDWEIHQTFDAEASAETYLDSLLTPAVTPAPSED